MHYIFISFCTKNGDIGLCLVVEDDSLSFYMEISVGILFPNNFMCVLFTSGDASSEILVWFKVDGMLEEFSPGLGFGHQSATGKSVL